MIKVIYLWFAGGNAEEGDNNEAIDANGATGAQGGTLAGVDTGGTCSERLWGRQWQFAACTKRGDTTAIHCYGDDACRYHNSERDKGMQRQ